MSDQAQTRGLVARRRAFVGALASLVGAGGLPGFETMSPDDA